MPDENLIALALNNVRRKEMSLTQASKVFGVPFETLRRRHNGGTAKIGRPTHFTSEEEQELVRLVISCEMAGIALSKRILFKTVMFTAIEKGQNCCTKMLLTCLNFAGKRFYGRD